MTYGDTGVRRRFFSRDLLFCVRCSWLLLLLLTSVLSTLPLGAASLIYDQASGNITGFNMDRGDIPSYASGYKGTLWPGNKERWENDGYIGRLLYTGEPTTFTFYKVGDKTGTGSGTTANRFYFTHLDSCSYWREYFLVIRAKGLRHDGKHIDIYGENTVIQENYGSSAKAVVKPDFSEKK